MVNSSRAQQRAQYSQYILNNFLLNPALAGIENYTDLKVGHRQQWSGLEGAPRTSYAHVNWALGDEYLWGNALSFDQDGSDPRSKSLVQHYTASPAHHGMGISIFSDEAAQLRSQGISLSYAYHLGLNGQLNLSAGLAVGVSRIGIDPNALLLEYSNDPVLANLGSGGIHPELSAGLWLYGGRFFAGVSAQQLLTQKAFSGGEGKLIPHFFATAGYKFFLMDEVNILPSALLKVVQGSPISLDANIKLGFRDRIWLGLGVRNGDAVDVMAGFNISHLLNLGYSYDLTTSSLSGTSSGSHEVVLGLLLNNVYRVLCPQRMW